MGKHVIFLGAGASKASCYPVASDLRLLLSSKHHFESWMWKCFPGNREAVNLALKHFSTFESSVMLFRNGGFASVDEFCRLVSGQDRRVEVEHMRLLTRAVLGALNPEDEFESLGQYPFVQSEYYPLVQKLFCEDLKSLYEGVSILSFNYDPYLEFLLRRAWAIRNGGLPDSDIGNSITSGFHNYQDAAWAKPDKRRLYLLKLHGSICEFVVRPGVTTELLFESSQKERAAALFDQNNVGIVPPIIFPWEILDEHHNFKNTHFPLRSDQYYFNLFVSIWERAQKEVLAADKISFVGLSMHEYLKLGFRYLFQGKKGRVQVVVANVLNDRFREGYRTGYQLHPNSPCRRVFDLLAEVTEKKLICDYSDLDRATIVNQPNNQGQRVTARYSFADFIEHEL